MTASAASDYRAAPKSRRSLLVGLALSVLIHAIALWALFERMPLRVEGMPPGKQGPLTVILAPPAVHSKTQHVAPRPSVAVAEKSSSRHLVTRKHMAKKPAVRAPEVMVKPARQATATPAPHVVPSPEDDMFTQIQEARRRRAEALAREENAAGPEIPPSRPQSEQNDRSVALANIARSLQYANDKDKVKAGGVFEVRDMGYEYAEVAFYGWSPNTRRNSTRVIPVERGTASDIETAVVNKIIDVIREDKTGTFLWDSHRLGRTVTLSARVQDTADLQQFLMQEFFPDHLPPTQR